MCVQCKARKVKCDAVAPVCGACELNGLHCTRISLPSTSRLTVCSGTGHFAQVRGRRTSWARNRLRVFTRARLGAVHAKNVLHRRLRPVPSLLAVIRVPRKVSLGNLVSSVLSAPRDANQRFKIVMLTYRPLREQDSNMHINMMSHLPHQHHP